MNNPGYKKLLLIVLSLILAFNNVDRLALGLMLQNIKVDLALSDTQLGLLSGIAFALFYSTMGIPIARWADRGNRVSIIAITTALWSAMVALCGGATSFLQLMLIRIGVAVGEAGCIPPAHSLIADFFSRAERPRAVALYMLGAPMSAVIGYFLAGWMNEFYGWRVTFVALGLPGVALAILAALVLKEPRKQRRTETRLPASLSEAPVRAREVVESNVQPSMKQVWMTLWFNPTFRQLLFAFAVLYFFASGIGNWQPSFFVRSHGVQTGELGTWFALIYGAGGIIGTYCGGELASRFAPNDERAQLKAMAIACAGLCVASMGIYLSKDVYLAFGLIFVATLVGTTINAPLFATIQSVVPARMRAVSIATIFLFANLIGMGFGPLLTGALSDALRAIAGEESLRYSLLALCPGYLWCGWHLWRASSTVGRDLETHSSLRTTQLARDGVTLTVGGLSEDRG